MGAQSGSRRLAAILAADVVGYSRMVAADEAGTRARQRAARRDVVDRLMAEFNGRVFKVMDDGLLAEFPSAVRAVRWLEGLAEPRGICISGRVREDASAKIALEVEDLGEPELKNIGQRPRPNIDAW